MYLSDFNDTVMSDYPESIFIVRIEEDTPYGTAYTNGIVYRESESENNTLITEQPLEETEESRIKIAGYVDIQEINLATIAIISNSIKRRYDI